MTVEKEIEYSLLKLYRDRTPNSKKIHNKNKLFVPGGDTRAIAHFEP